MLIKRHCIELCRFMRHQNAAQWFMILCGLPGGVLCYLVQSVSCGGGAGAVVLRRDVFLLGSLQEILGRSRPPGAQRWMDPVQSAVELLGQSQVLMRLWGQLLGAQGWISARRLTLSTELCFRDEILEDLGPELRRGAWRTTEGRNQEEELWNCNNNVIIHRKM